MGRGVKGSRLTLVGSQLLIPALSALMRARRRDSQSPAGARSAPQSPVESVRCGRGSVPLACSQQCGWCNPFRFGAPVAQLDRVSGYEPEGREFESLQARQIIQGQDTAGYVKPVLAGKIRTPDSKQAEFDAGAKRRRSPARATPSASEGRGAAGPEVISPGAPTSLGPNRAHRQLAVVRSHAIDGVCVVSPRSTSQSSQ
jgi:hypothetical protein